MHRATKRTSNIKRAECRAAVAHRSSAVAQEVLNLLQVPSIDGAGEDFVGADDLSRHLWRLQASDCFDCARHGTLAKLPQMKGDLTDIAASCKQTSDGREQPAE